MEQTYCFIGFTASFICILSGHSTNSVTLSRFSAAAVVAAGVGIAAVLVVVVAEVLKDASVFVGDRNSHDRFSF